MQRIILVCLAGVLLGLLGATCRAADPDEFTVFTYDHAGTDLPGRLFVPTDYDPGQSYPIVVFLHGSGERGTDNTSQVNVNIDNLLAAAKERDFFLYAPQIGDSASWEPRYATMTMTMVAKAIDQYSIDMNRIYVTGLSLGGAGAWVTASHYSGAVAAAVPISGYAGQILPERMVGQPIWAYHAINDPLNSVNTTRGGINAIRAADGGKPPLSFPLNNSTSNPYYSDGSPYYTDGSTFYSENNLRYTEYSSGGHFIWPRVYNEQPMYDWLLAQQENVTPVQVGETMLFDFGGNTFGPGPDSQDRIWNSSRYNDERTLEAVLPFAITSEGRRTSVMLRVSDAFLQFQSNGVTEGSAYDAAIAQDSWFTGSYNGNADAQNEPGAFIIEGLDPTLTYRVEIFGSYNSDDGGRGRISRYTIGDEYHDLDVVGNLTDTAVFEMVHPDTSGAIEVIVTAADGTTSRFAHISAIELTAIPEPASLSLMGLGMLALIRRRQ